MRGRWRDGEDKLKLEDYERVRESGLFNHQSGYVDTSMRLGASPIGVGFMRLKHMWLM